MRFLSSAVYDTGQDKMKITARRKAQARPFNIWTSPVFHQVLQGKSNCFTRLGCERSRIKIADDFHRLSG
jgi:hypothetical protein